MLLTFEAGLKLLLQRGESYICSLCAGDLFRFFFLLSEGWKFLWCIIWLILWLFAGKKSALIRHINLTNLRGVFDFFVLAWGSWRSADSTESCASGGTGLSDFLPPLLPLRRFFFRGSSEADCSSGVAALVAGGEATVAIVVSTLITPAFDSFLFRFLLAG